MRVYRALAAVLLAAALGSVAAPAEAQMPSPVPQIIKMGGAEMYDQVFMFWKSLCWSKTETDRSRKLTEDVADHFELADRPDRSANKSAGLADIFLRLADLRAEDGGGALCWELDKDGGGRLVLRSGLVGQMVALAGDETLRRADALLRKLVSEFLASERSGPKWEALARLTMVLTSPETTDEHLTPELLSAWKLADSDVARVWASNYVSGMMETALVEERTYARLRRAVSDFGTLLAPLWTSPGAGPHATFYAASYVDPEADRPVKEFINGLLRRVSDKTAAAWQGRPGPVGTRDGAPDGRLRVGVVTGLWFPRHAVHRTLRRYVMALQNSSRFEVELLYTSEPQKDADARGFAKVHQLAKGPGGESGVPRQLIDLCLSGNKGYRYDIIYLPDVGMSTASLVGANMRLAPIMLAGVGHSVSTFGSRVDYFVSGDVVEAPRAPDGSEPAAARYSESLLLLPGSGVAHMPPLFKRSRISRTPLPPPSNATKELRINCAFTGQKTGAPFVSVLREILVRSTRKVMLRFFPSSRNHVSAMLLKAKLRRALGLDPAAADERGVRPSDPLALGHQVHVMPRLENDQYFEELQKGHMMIESHHYGGCNTVVDALFVGLPVVTWEGDRWFNRIGSAIVRQADPGGALGLERDLVAKDRASYVDRVLSLVNDPAHLQDVWDRVGRAPVLDEILLRTGRQHLVDPATGLVTPGLPSIPEEDFFPLALLHVHSLGPVHDHKPTVIRMREVLAGGSSGTAGSDPKSKAAKGTEPKNSKANSKKKGSETNRGGEL